MKRSQIYYLSALVYDIYIQIQQVFLIGAGISFQIEPRGVLTTNILPNKLTRTNTFDEK